MFKRDQIRSEIEQLQGHVLTFYLNTDPISEEWKIRLKNGLKRTEEYHRVSDPNGTKLLTDIVKKVQVAIRDKQKNFANSLVCFASKDQVLLYPFQFPVENDFIWDEAPQTEQLKQLFEKYLRTGIIILQFDKITLMTVSLGVLMDEVSYAIDIDTEKWRQFKGASYGNRNALNANHRDKFERRVKENQARWYKSIVPTIEQYAKKQGWKSVHLIGTSELMNHMKNQLNIKVNSEHNRNLAGKSVNTILQRTIYAQRVAG